jgi:hypothetical protein
MKRNVYIEKQMKEAKLHGNKRNMYMYIKEKEER